MPTVPGSSYWCRQRDFLLSASHVAGDQNFIADFISEEFSFHRNGLLSRTSSTEFVCLSAGRRWTCLFVSVLNYRLPRFLLEDSRLARVGSERSLLPYVQPCSEGPRNDSGRRVADSSSSPSVVKQTVFFPRLLSLLVKISKKRNSGLSAGLLHQPLSHLHHQTVPGRMRTSICECICQRLLCDRAARLGLLPRDWILCTRSAALKLFSMTGVIIIM